VSQPLNGDDDDVSARSKENDDEDTEASKQAKQVSQPLNGDDDDVSARSKENDDEDTDASEQWHEGWRLGFCGREKRLGL
jgi:hypothetical protein